LCMNFYEIRLEIDLNRPGIAGGGLI
jgi:hypothetical protein